MTDTELKLEAESPSTPPDFEMAEKVFSYFLTMSSLSNKVMNDIEDVKEKCGERWDTLDFDQQYQAIIDGLIPLKVREKYGYTPPTSPPDYSHLKLKQPNRKSKAKLRKTVIDEFSGPFHWETRSQSEHCVFDNEGHQEDDEEDDIHLEEVDIDLDGPEVEEGDHQDSPEENSSEGDKPQLKPDIENVKLALQSELMRVVNRHQEQLKAKQKELARESTTSSEVVVAPLRSVVPEKHIGIVSPVSPVGCIIGAAQVDDEDLPKTGFDFLDNW